MDLMKANKDPEIQIKENDKYFYHVEHLRIMPDSTGKHPARNTRIQVYSKKDFNAHFGKSGYVAKHGLMATGDDEIRVVHDPVLQLKMEDDAIIKATRKPPGRPAKSNT